MNFGNIEICDENIRALSKEITGMGEKYHMDVEGNISIGDDMQASTQIGVMRHNQEDAVLLMKREDNEKYKMMVVADGMGGHECGERASHVTVQEIKSWFNSLPLDIFKNDEELINSLKVKLKEINSKIVGWGNDSGTTFVCALVAEEHTHILSLGDSRAYRISGKHLIQITRDDSPAYDDYMRGRIKKKDDMRFAKNSNCITNCLGNDALFRVNTRTISNDMYDAILLFSDGVTDCLSDNDILAITKSTDPKKVAQKIVEGAIKHNSVREREVDEYGYPVDDNVDFYDEIPGGKDNTTAAVLYSHAEENDGGMDTNDRWYNWNRRKWRKQEV